MYFTQSEMVGMLIMRVAWGRIIWEMGGFLWVVYAGTFYGSWEGGVGMGGWAEC